MRTFIAYVLDMFYTEECAEVQAPSGTSVSALPLLFQWESTSS